MKLGDDALMGGDPFTVVAAIVVAVLGSMALRGLTRRLDSLLTAATISLRAYSEISDRLRVLEARMEDVLLGRVDSPKGVSPQTYEEILSRVIAEAPTQLQRIKMAEAEVQRAQAAKAPEAIHAEVERQLNKGLVAAFRDAAAATHDTTPLGRFENELRRLAAEFEREQRAVEAAVKAQQDRRSDPNDASR